MSCQICTETFNKNTNSIVTCSYCSKDACKNCVRTYLLNHDDEAQCMFCKNPQDMIFLAVNLNKTWVHSKYKKHREKILLDKQVAQLPDTQEKARKTKLSREYVEEIKQLNNEKKNLTAKLRAITTKIHEHNINIRAILNSESKTVNVFTFKCPHSECSGFLDSSWMCGLCDNKTCKDCMEIITDNHECNPEKVETVKLIRRDTKPCPGCGEFIHKLNGCDQMWCPTCKVAFSWKSGQIENGNIHNPEYYRWMRENNSEIPQNHNNNCGQIPNASFLLQSIRKIWIPTNRTGRLDDDLYVHILYNCHRLVAHVGMIENTYRREINMKDAKLEDLRVKYLLNEIDKDTWMTKIQILDKAFKKLTDIINIWRLVRDTALPLLWYTVEQFHDTENLTVIGERLLKNVFPQLEKIRNFCNESFIRIGNLYSSDNEFITPAWSNMGYKSYKRAIAK